jgi:hypothetical protein
MSARIASRLVQSFSATAFGPEQLVEVCFDFELFANGGWVRVPRFLSVQYLKNHGLSTYPICATCALSVVIAVVSLVCIALSLSLYDYYQPKSDLGVLVAVPGLCLTASTMA